MMSTNDICYRGLRIYRNSVVEHIRDVLKAKYPEDWESRISKPFQKDWEDRRKAAELRRETGELAVPLEDAADLLDVNHFRNLFEIHFDDLFPPDEKSILRKASEQKEVRQQTREAIVRWSQAFKNLRDPVIGHPATMDVDKEDAFMMLDSARRILGFIEPDTASRVRDLLHELWNSSESILEPRRLESSTLPSREAIAPSFIGRQKELAVLWDEWLRDPQSHRVHYLVGDGGKGKTALAYHFAEEVINQPPQGMEIVIWLSAKLRQFVEGQTTNIENPDFWDLNSALDWILWAYGAPDFQNMSLDDKVQECLRYLHDLPALVVVDDVDSLEGEGEDLALDFFTRQTEGSLSKFLLTSRRMSFGARRISTQVEGFSKEEGRAFVSSRVKLFELDSSFFPDAVVDRILDTCDDSPLYVQDLLRLCGSGRHPNQAIEEWREREGEEARLYALSREVDLLSQSYPSARKVLLTCAMFPEPVTRDEIKTVSEISYRACDDAIGGLQNLFLVPKPANILGKPRFALDLNTKKLVLEVEGESEERNRIERVMRSLRGQRSSSERYGVGMYIQQAINSANRGKHSDAEEILKRGLNVYRDASALHSRLGWLYGKWEPRPQIHAARDHFRRAGDLKSPDVHTYFQWWRLELKIGEWGYAAEAAEKGIANGVVPSGELHHKAGIVRSRLAWELRRQAQYDRANQEAQKAENHFKAALSRVTEVGSNQCQFRARVYGDIVAHYELLIGTFRGQAQSRRFQLLAEALERWQSELPNDPKSSAERQRLLGKFPNLSGYLNG